MGAGQPPGPPGQPQGVRVPVQIAQQIARQGASSAMFQIANAIVDGDYEGSEVISEAHKMLIGDMVLTLAQNAGLETMKCEHCEGVRLEHPLNLVDGFRYCEEKHQPKLPEVTDPATEQEAPELLRFQPRQPEEKSRIVQPGGPKPSGGIIMPG